MAILLLTFCSKTDDMKINPDDGFRFQGTFFLTPHSSFESSGMNGGFD